MNRKKFIIRRAKARGVPMKGASESRKVALIIRQLTWLLTSRKSRVGKTTVSVVQMYTIGFLHSKSSFYTMAENSQNARRAGNVLHTANNIVPYGDWDGVVRLLTNAIRFAKASIAELRRQGR